MGTLKLRVEGGGFTVEPRVRRAGARRPGAAWCARAPRRCSRARPLSMGGDLAAGLMPGTVSARMTVTTQPPIPFARALQDLLDYPYGCVEQTTTQRLRGPAAGRRQRPTHGLRRPGRSQARAPAHGRRLQPAGRAAVAATATSRCGAAATTATILTPYIAEFLLTAREAGFAVPDAMLQKALERLSEDLLTGGVPVLRLRRLRPPALRLPGAGRLRAGQGEPGAAGHAARAVRQRARQVAHRPAAGAPGPGPGDAGRRGPRQQGDRRRPGQAGRAPALARRLRLRPARPEPDAGPAAREQAHRGWPGPASCWPCRATCRRASPHTHYWLSTQEQIALARLGKSLAAGRQRHVLRPAQRGRRRHRHRRRPHAQSRLRPWRPRGRRALRTEGASRRCTPASTWPACRAVRRRWTTARSWSKRNWYNPDGTAWKPRPAEGRPGAGRPR